MTNSGFSVALIGPYPPPYGGVSVHLKRLVARLETNGVRAQIYCQPLPKGTGRDNIVSVRRHLLWQWWLPQYGWRCKETIIHCHQGWSWTPAMWAMRRLGHQIVMTIHNQMVFEQWGRTSELERQTARALFADRSVAWVAVSSEVQKRLLKIGVPAKRIAVIPAYLTPTQLGDQAPQLPASLQVFLRSHYPVLSAYGTNLAFDPQGCDLYGYDLCIELVHQLKEEYPSIGLAISVNQVNRPDYLADLKRRIDRYGLQSNMLFFTEPLEEAYPLWQASNLYVRPTTTDGDSLAVREALSLGVPVVASDVSPRPECVEVFRSRDLTELVGSVRQVLQNQEVYRRTAAEFSRTDNFAPLLALYNTLVASD